MFVLLCIFDICEWCEVVVEVFVVLICVVVLVVVVLFFDVVENQDGCFGEFDDYVEVGGYFVDVVYFLEFVEDLFWVVVFWSLW